MAAGAVEFPQSVTMSHFISFWRSFSPRSILGLMV